MPDYPVRDGAGDVIVSVANSGVKPTEAQSASTGLLTGGDITIASSTTVDIAAGTGQVVDASDPAGITRTQVAWAAKTGVPITNVATQPTTFLALDAAGSVVEYAEFPNNGDLRGTIIIGSAVHAGGVITSVSQLTAVRPFQLGPTLTDLVDALGVVKLLDPAGAANLVVDGDPAGNLSVRRGAGKVFFGGIQRDPTEPNTLDTPAATAPTMITTWRDGAGGHKFGSGALIPAGVYDDNAGADVAPTGAVSTNAWVNHRVYYSPDTDETILVYGQQTYNASADAVASLRTETPDVTPALLEVPVVAAITMRGGATDLTLAGDAVFTQSNKFGFF